MSIGTLTRQVSLPPLPVARGGAASAVCGDRVYVIGGAVSPYDFLNTADCFDPTAGTWRPLPPMLTPRGNLVSAVLGNRIYVLGGAMRPKMWRPGDPPQSKPSQAVEFFNTATETWGRAADLPCGLVRPAVGAIHGKIYAASGRQGNYNSKYVFEYDPEKNRWTRVARCPIAVRHASSCIFNNRLYYSGGVYYGGLGHHRNKVRLSRQVFEFNPAEHSFRELPHLKSERSAHAMWAFETRLYVAGGVTRDKSPNLDIDVLELGHATWRTVARLDQPRDIFEACVLGSSVYFLAGFTHHYRHLNTTAVAYDLHDLV